MAKPKTTAKPVKTRQRASRSQSSKPWLKSANAGSLYALAGLVAVIGLLVVLLRNKQIPPKETYIPRNKAPSTPVNVKRSWKRTSVGPEKGVVATQDIPAGSLIILDTPFIGIPESQNRSLVTEYLLQTVEKLSPASKSDYFNLPFTPKHLSKGAEAAELAVNIFESNAISAGKTSAVFKNACYIKHSCNPNADFFYRDDLNALVVQAVKDIPKGAEIFCPHFDSSVMTRDERQAHMHDTRGVPCDCEACSVTGPSLVESDARRQQLAAIRGLIHNWGDNDNVEPERVLNAIEQAYDLLEEEDYRADLGWWAANAVQVAAAHEDAEGVTKWATRAAAYYVEQAGSDAPQVKALLRIAQNPQLANAWSARIPKPEDEEIDFDTLDDETDAEDADEVETLVDDIEEFETAPAKAQEAASPEAEAAAAP